MKEFFLSASLMLTTILFIGQVETAAYTPVKVSQTKQITKGYKTYSLFLICNPQWFPSKWAKKDTQLIDLYEQFDSFGSAIGDENAAVWFWKKDSDSHLSASLARNVDVQRSVRFCRAWNLKPSAGPHLVVTSTYPDESKLSSGLPKDSAVFEFGKMSSKEISDLLAKLADDLLEERHVAPVATEARSAWWVRLLEATQGELSSFVCAWSFKIDAGEVKAEVHSCPTH